MHTPLLPVGVLLLLTAVGPAGAQDVNPAAPYIGRTVLSVSIEVEGELRDEPELMAAVLGLASRPLSQAGWRAAMTRLMGLGQFDDVEVVVAPVDDGVAVIFRLAPRHPIDRLEFTGETGVPPSVLDRLVRSRYGGIPTSQPIREVADTVERLLYEQGYQNAVVTPSTVETHQPDRATLVLQIEAGPPAVVASVEVVGDSPFAPSTIAARAGVAIGEPYRRRDVQTRMIEIEESLRQDRYYEAIARPSFVPRPEDGRVDVTLLVEAGPRVELRVQGLLPGPVEELIPLARDRSADIDLLQDSERRIESALRREGFRDARAPFRRDESADGSTVTITYTITRGRRYRIDAVELTGTTDLPAPVIDEALNLPAGEPFSAEAVGAAQTRLVVALQELGYYRASSDATYEFTGTSGLGEQLVTVRIGVTAGPRADVSEIVFEFQDRPHLLREELLDVMRAKTGQPYVLSHGLSDFQSLERLYRDRGFPSAAVSITPAFEDDGRRVRLVVDVAEGPQMFVGSIAVVGNEAVSGVTVLETMTIRTGSPLGESALLESRRRLLDLGLFRQVTIAQQPVPPGETIVDLVVSVQEMPNNTLGFGGGLEVGRRPRAATADGRTDILELAPRGFFEIGRRNIGGRNRQVNLFSRVALKPRRSTDPEGDDSRFGFTEYRVTGTFREQRAFRTDTNLLFGLTFEQGVRTLYNFARRALNAEVLRGVSPGLSVSGRWALDFSRLFDVGILEEEQSLIDRLFPQVRLSLLSTGIVWDRRNDAIAPSAGSLLTGDLEFAVRSLGSEVGYAKVFVQASDYRTVSEDERVVLATRVQLGVARGLERDVPVEDDDGDPVIGPDGQPVTETIADLPASQRFFAGGGTTVRGFQIDRLGVPEILNDNGLSNGGNAVVVLNAEVRAVVLQVRGHDLGMVGFIDAGNVFAKAADLDFGRLRSALGFGFRYDSPLGPLRLDFGFKTRRLIIGGRRERGWEYHLSIGEAF